MTDLSHIDDETMKEWGGLSASLLSVPSKRDLTVSDERCKPVVVKRVSAARAAAMLGDE